MQVNIINNIIGSVQPELTLEKQTVQREASCCRITAIEGFINVNVNG